MPDILARVDYEGLAAVLEGIDEYCTQYASNHAVIAALQDLRGSLEGDCRRQGLSYPPSAYGRSPDLWSETSETTW